MKPTDSPSKPSVVLELDPFLKGQGITARFLGYLGWALLAAAVALLVLGKSGSGRPVYNILCLGALMCLMRFYFLGPSGRKSLGIRIESDEDQVRLLQHGIEKGVARWSDVASIKWTQAPFELPSMAIFELRNDDDGVLLAVPVPEVLTPARWDSVIDGDWNYRDLYPWSTFIKSVRDRFSGRERLGARFDIDANQVARERMGREIEWLFAVVLMIFPLCTYSEFVGFRDISLSKTTAAVLKGIIEVTWPIFYFSILGFRIGKSFHTRGWHTLRMRAYNEAKQSTQPRTGRWRYAEREMAEASVEDFIAPKRPVLGRFVAGGVAMLASAVFVALLGKVPLLALAFVALGLGLFFWGSKFRAKLRDFELLLGQLDNEFQFRTNGSVSVLTAEGRQIDFPSGSGRWLDEYRGVMLYVHGDDRVVVDLPLLDPVEASEVENEEEGHDDQ